MNENNPRDKIDRIMASRGLWWFVFCWNAFWCPWNFVVAVTGPSFLAAIMFLICGAMAWYSWSLLHDERINWPDDTRE